MFSQRLRKLSSSLPPTWERFARLKDDDANRFQTILGGKKDVVQDTLELAKYNTDWTRKYKGRSSLVLRPSTVHQVSQILAYCNERRLAVVPQGGNTGLVGGGVPVQDEIIISLEKLNQILHHDPVSGVLKVQAGCILEVADNFLRERGFLMPLDLGAKGSCQVGGNIATNAGGLRVLRYGSLHGSVLGLQVVLADGTVVEGLNTCRKDNTGYDWKQLLIGSEGTLGVITAATFQTPALPKSVNVALCTLNDYESIVRMFARTKEHLGEILSAFEFWDEAAQSLSETHSPSGAKLPIAKGPFYVLIETSGSNQDHDGEKLMSLFAILQDEGAIIDATLAQDTSQARSLWAWREGIPEACSREGLVIKYDVSLPTTLMYGSVVALRGRLSGIPGVRQITGYGHFGDGNIHLNVAVRSPIDPAITEALEPFIYRFIRTLIHSNVLVKPCVGDGGGSISAEHGIGQMKTKYLAYSKTPQELAIMRQIKSMFDPNGILNPYKVLPDHEQEE